MKTKSMPGKSVDLHSRRVLMWEFPQLLSCVALHMLVHMQVFGNLFVRLQFFTPCLIWCLLHMSALKSTENCVCILNNLSYQVEAELPKKYASHLRESRQSLAPEPKAVGCFAHRSAKITEVIPLDNNPHWQYKGCPCLVLESDILWKLLDCCNFNHP